MIFRNGQYELHSSKTFHSSVSAAAVNEDGTIIVGLESGEIEILQYDSEKTEQAERLSSILSVDKR